MAEAHIMIYNYFFSLNLALQICLKKELRLYALCLMAEAHIMIYNYFFSLNLALQICLKKC
jgi:glucose-6-phosphate-specific signal transduction histidine kinase